MNKKTIELRNWLVTSSSIYPETEALFAYKTAMMDVIAKLDHIHANAMQTCAVCRQALRKNNGTPVYDEDMSLSGWMCCECADRAVRWHDETKN